MASITTNKEEVENVVEPAVETDSNDSNGSDPPLMVDSADECCGSSIEGVSPETKMIETKTSPQALVSFKLPESAVQKQEQQQVDFDNKQKHKKNGTNKLVSTMKSTIDTCLSKWAKYLSNSTNQDRALKFLQWTLWLFSRYYVVRRTRSSKALRKLYLDVSFARYVTRLLGLVGTVDAVRNDSWCVKPSSTNSNLNRIYKYLGRIMSWSMIGYYPTEHMAYVQWMVPASARNLRSAERWSYISCRFWFIYIVAESVQCMLQYKELQDQIKKNTATNATDKGDSGDDTTKSQQQLDDETQLALQLRQVQYQLTRNALFALPCIHWSLPNWDTQPWLPESLVNTLMWLESIVSLYQ